jgi:flagellar secretion chaperone FliS
MYNSAFAGNKSNRTNQYLVKEIMEATPQQLVLKVYDFAILNCQRHNLVKTNDALQVLINALRFDTEEVKKISAGLLRLYQYCQEEMRHKNFEIVYKILTELRESWINAFNNGK